MNSTATLTMPPTPGLLDTKNLPDLIVTPQAQRQLDAHRRGITAERAAYDLAELAEAGDVIEDFPASRVAPIGVPRSRRLARKQAQGEVRDAIKHFRRKRLERARAEVAGLPDDLRDRSYHPADVAEAREVLPKDATLIEVLTEAARVADLRTRLVIVDDVATGDADFGSVYDDLDGASAKDRP